MDLPLAIQMEIVRWIADTEYYLLQNPLGNGRVLFDFFNLPFLSNLLLTANFKILRNTHIYSKILKFAVISSTTSFAFVSLSFGEYAPHERTVSLAYGAN
jgi:hypothetical protein